jgi:DNA-binding GntR family transcriptional regulator
MADLSKHARVSDAIRTAINDGSIAPGEMLTAGIVGSRFGVSRQSAYRALVILAAEGRIVPERGAGHRVRE